jgi:lipopolysaccharide/colanic/teichoic acid biosynthesis glycosyltransferase
VLVGIAIAVKLSSRGPVLYRSIRPGIGGAPFACLKFRTMYRDADQRQADLESLNEASGAIFKIKHDPRLTSIGRVLRRFSLDELPQLVNVFRGEMSLVGPRPLPMRDFDRLDSWHKKRYLVLPASPACGRSRAGRTSTSTTSCASTSCTSSAGRRSST